jgi:hypothetical protein
MQPSYIIRANETEEDPNSIYRLEWFDAEGNVIDTYGLPINKIADLPGKISIVAGVPIPGGFVDSYKVWQNEVLIAEETFLVDSQRSEASLSDSYRGLRLMWQADHRPALIRFTEDGSTWITLGIDVTGSEIEVDRPDGPGQFEVHFANSIGPSLLSYEQ